MESMRNIQRLIVLSICLCISQTALARSGQDCNENNIDDLIDIALCDGDPNCGDCNGNSIPDGCEYETGGDCDGNGLLDACEIDYGSADDCNYNYIIDSCELDDDPNDPNYYYRYYTTTSETRTPEVVSITGKAKDCNGNGIPDECDLDSGFSSDLNENYIPDECEADCNRNELTDIEEIMRGLVDDCNGNMIPDECEISEGAADIDQNGVLDTCQEDCDSNGLPDSYELSLGASDCNNNGKLDVCETDSDNNGVIDDCQSGQNTPPVEPNEPVEPNQPVESPTDPNQSAQQPDPNTVDGTLTRNLVLEVIRAINALLAGLDPVEDAQDVETLEMFAALLTEQPLTAVTPDGRLAVDAALQTVADVYSRNESELNSTQASTVRDVLNSGGMNAQPVAATGLCPMMAMLLLTGLTLLTVRGRSQR